MLLHVGSKSPKIADVDRFVVRRILVKFFIHNHPSHVQHLIRPAQHPRVASAEEEDSLNAVRNSRGLVLLVGVTRLTMTLFCFSAS